MAPCECSIRRQRERLLDRIPPAYRQLRLATVEGLDERHGKQGEVLERMRQAPRDSYLFCGRNGAGKSLFGWLLYRQALEDGRPVVALPAAELLAQFRRWELHQEPPAIDAEGLRNDRAWFVFLDEFDKARPTEFAAESMFALLDAIYSYQHQLVISSNLDPRQLRDHWSRSEISYGSSIMRRLFELENSCLVQMF